MNPVVVSYVERIVSSRRIQNGGSDRRVSQNDFPVTGAAVVNRRWRPFNGNGYGFNLPIVRFELLVVLIDLSTLAARVVRTIRRRSAYW